MLLYHSFIIRLGRDMKKFAKILICLILCVFTIGLTACGKKDKFPYPSSSEITYSNGGLAVRKGNYLYYVNGYMSANDMQDKKATYTVGALMVAKLDANGNMVVDSNKLMMEDYYRTMSNKLCGFEATNLFIFGDYLYFTSPCLENESGKNGEWAKTRVVFYRVKLDNSGKVEEIYTSNTSNANLEYSYYNYNGATYLLVYEKGASISDSNINNRLVRISVGDKKVGKSEQVSLDVSGIVMPKETANESNNSAKFAHNSIFYTKSENSKQSLYRYNVISNESTKVGSYNDLTLNFVVEGKLFATMSTEYANSKNLCVATISGTNLTFNTAWSSTDLYSNVYLSNEGEVVIAVKSNGQVSAKWLGESSSRVLFTEADEVHAIGFANGSFIYYDKNNNVKSFSYSNFFKGESVEVKTLATLTNANTNHFDLNDDYMYFYQKVGENYYLHRLQISGNEGNKAQEMFGVYLSADIPTE